MKTANEFIIEVANEENKAKGLPPMSDEDVFNHREYIARLEKAMKEYALSVAENVQERIANNVKMDIVISDASVTEASKENIDQLMGRYLNSDPSKVKLKVDKNSIMNTEIITP